MIKVVLSFLAGAGEFLVGDAALISDVLGAGRQSELHVYEGLSNLRKRRAVGKIFLAHFYQSRPTTQLCGLQFRC